MKIKEFSQKYSEVLFYVSIVLFIISIALSISLYSVNNKQIGFRKDMNFERNGQMQDNDFRQNRRSNRNNNFMNTNQPTDTEGQSQTPTESPTTETPSVTQ